MKAEGTPLIVSGLASAQPVCFALERVPFGVQKDGGPGSRYLERSLQQLIQDNPALLPIDRIEPSLASPIPICMELPLPSGFADNLMVTAEGGLILVETKLWRNPEARREVVGQILDYAKDLSRTDYEDLEKRIRLARTDSRLNLIDLVRQHSADVDEGRFIDNLSRNMRLGRMLLLVVGDGIQEGAEQLGEFLQQHVGLSFSLALVEMALWKLPNEDRLLVQPRVLTRTTQIERAVIRVDVSPGSPAVSVLPPASSKPQKSSTITSEVFYETLGQVDPSLPRRLQTLLAKVEPLGVVAEVKNLMTLKWRSVDGTAFSLGWIDKDGTLTTDTVNWAADGVGRIDLALKYQQEMAGLIPNGQVRQTAKTTGWRVVLGSTTKNPPVGALLDRADEWAAAIRRYIEAMAAALEQRE